MDELVVKDLIDRLIDLSFAEDIGDGDHTTLSCIPADAMGKSKLLIKEEGILAGIEVAKEVFRRFDPTMKVEVFIQDGTHVKPGDVAMMVEGKVQSLLQTERLMLNIMQRMSGIATMTNKYVKKLEGTKTRVLDTRKTTPNCRVFEKYAVRIGGGNNHRYNLTDGVLLKDNHIGAAGGVKQAVTMAKEYAPFVRKIEVETENLDMVREALEANVDIIMLDNMDLDMAKKAIEIIDNKAITEFSGNVSLDNIEDVGKIGVDYVSIGALTHSYKVLDLSIKNLKIIK